MKTSTVPGQSADIVRISYNVYTFLPWIFVKYNCMYQLSSRVYQGQRIIKFKYDDKSLLCVANAHNVISNIQLQIPQRT